jgi:hypothetical protein
MSEEKKWSNENDSRLLRELASKLKSVPGASEVLSAAAKTAESREVAQLDAIIAKYKVSAEDKAKLLEWRHTTL